MSAGEFTDDGKPLAIPGAIYTSTEERRPPEADTDEQALSYIAWRAARLSAQNRLAARNLPRD